MLTRREFLGGFAAGLVAGGTHPVHSRRVEPLFKSPDGHPNGLEATHEGLWVAEQVSDAAYLLDWKTGRVLRKVETESSNSSGIAYGGGFLWMAANGSARNRLPRPHDATTGEVIKTDARTGKTVARHPVPGGGGVHGLVWAGDCLWVTTLKLQKLTKVDMNFKMLHSIPVTLNRAHGLGWAGEQEVVNTADFARATRSSFASWPDGHATKPSWHGRLAREGLAIDCNLGGATIDDWRELDFRV